MLDGAVDQSETYRKEVLGRNKIYICKKEGENQAEVDSLKILDFKFLDLTSSKLAKEFLCLLIQVYVLYENI